MNAYIKRIGIFFILFSSTLFAQEPFTWPMPGATWTYLSFDCKEFAYTRDTLINTHTYSVVDLVAVNNDPLTLDDLYIGWNVRDFSTFFRTSGDTIFRWVGGNDYVFMIQGIELGNSFESFRSAEYDWNSFACIEMLPLEVNHIEEVEYSGHTFREVGLEAVDWTESWGYFPYHGESTFVFIENIGLKSNFVYFMDGYTEGNSGDINDCAFTVVEALFMGFLYHYEDDEVSISISGSDCQPSSTVNYRDENDFTIYPNPGNGMVNFKFKTDKAGTVNIEVFDLSGQLLHIGRINPSGDQIDLSSLSPGLYLIRAQDETGVYTQKLIME